MRVLFCHDGPLREDENGVYYGVSHTDKMFLRYYTLANEVRVAIRVKNVLAKDVYGKLSRITLDNLSVIQCPNMASVKGLLFDKIRLQKILQAEIAEADYIIARLPSHIGNMAVDIAKENGKPYLVEVVACPWDSLWNYSLKGKIVAPFMTLATKMRVKHADHVIYVTNEFLQRRYPTNGKHMNCSNVLITKYDEAILNSRLVNIEKKADKIILGTTAAVNVRFKGQQYVIEALGELKRRGNLNYEYHIVGSGDQGYLKTVAKKHDVSEQVKFGGAMPHDKVFEWLDTIDIYVQPSRQEGLPRALIEAMSRGLPAFGAITGGIPELLEKEFIFSNTRHNIEEICSILLNFNTNKMKEQARRNFLEAKKYDQFVIEDRRQAFFKVFMNTCKSK